MKNIGKVLNTFSAKKEQSGLPRPEVEELNLISGFGIKDDKFAGTDEEKAVMIVGKFAYDLAKEHGVNLEKGSLGENILFDFNPHEYNIGTVFKIGDAVFEITQACTICNHLSIFGDELPTLLKHCRGLYCKIINSGDITSGMTVKFVSNWQKDIAS